MPTARKLPRQRAEEMTLAELVRLTKSGAIEMRLERFGKLGRSHSCRLLIEGELYASGRANTAAEALLAAWTNALERNDSAAAKAESYGRRERVA